MRRETFRQASAKDPAKPNLSSPPEVMHFIQTFPGGTTFYRHQDGTLDAQVSDRYGQPWYMYRVREGKHGLEEKTQAQKALLKKLRGTGLLKAAKFPKWPFLEYSPWYKQALEPDVLMGRRGFLGWHERIWNAGLADYGSAYGWIRQETPYDGLIDFATGYARWRSLMIEDLGLRPAMEWMSETMGGFTTMWGELDYFEKWVVGTVGVAAIALGGWMIGLPLAPMLVGAGLYSAGLGMTLAADAWRESSGENWGATALHVGGSVTKIIGGLVMAKPVLGPFFAAHPWLARAALTGFYASETISAGLALREGISGHQFARRYGPSIALPLLYSAFRAGRAGVGWVASRPGVGRAIAGLDRAAGGIYGRLSGQSVYIRTGLSRGIVRNPVFRAIVESRAVGPFIRRSILAHLGYRHTWRGKTFQERWVAAHIEKRYRAREGTRWMILRDTPEGLRRRPPGASELRLKELGDPANERWFNGNSGILKPPPLPKGNFLERSPWYRRTIEHDVLLGRRGVVGWNGGPVDEGLLLEGEWPKVHIEPPGFWEQLGQRWDENPWETLAFLGIGALALVGGIALTILSGGTLAGVVIGGAIAGFGMGFGLTGAVTGDPGEALMAGAIGAIAGAVGGAVGHAAGSWAGAHMTVGALKAGTWTAANVARMSVVGAVGGGAGGLAGGFTGGFLGGLSQGQSFGQALNSGWEAGTKGAMIGSAAGFAVPWAAYGIRNIPAGARAIGRAARYLARTRAARRIGYWTRRFHRDQFGKPPDPHEIAKKIAEEYKGTELQCKPCAEDIQAAMLEIGESGERIEISWAEYDRAFIWSETAQGTISINGRHLGTLIGPLGPGARMYDPIHAGIPYDDWLADFLHWSGLDPTVIRTPF